MVGEYTAENRRDIAKTQSFLHDDAADDNFLTCSSKNSRAKHYGVRIDCQSVRIEHVKCYEPFQNI